MLASSTSFIRTSGKRTATPQPRNRVADDRKTTAKCESTYLEIAQTYLDEIRSLLRVQIKLGLGGTLRYVLEMRIRAKAFQREIYKNFVAEVVKRHETTIADTPTYIED